MEKELYAAAWGFAGAFCWASMEWLSCRYGTSSGPRMRCHLELGIRLITGAVSAAAGTGLAVGIWELQAHSHTVAAVIGAVANPALPKLQEYLPGLMKAIRGAGPK